MIVAVMFIPATNKNAGAWNIFVWTSLFTGIGIEICFFAIEWYARSNEECPRNIVSRIITNLVRR